MKMCSGLLGFVLLAAGFIMPAVPNAILAHDGKVELTLRLLPAYYHVEIAPGETETIYLEIVNSGDTAITNITLSADTPRGWTVDFRPDNLDNLGVGSLQAIDITVTTDPNAKEGEYTLTMIAEAEQARAVTSTIMRVENTSSAWQWVGLGIGLAVIAGFVLLYRRFGRE